MWPSGRSGYGSSLAGDFTSVRIRPGPLGAAPSKAAGPFQFLTLCATCARALNLLPRFAIGLKKNVPHIGGQMGVKQSTVRANGPGTKDFRSAAANHSDLSR